MNKRRGFTLIELVVVVAIIAILAAIALPSYTSYIRKGRRSAVEGSIQQIALSEERFRADCPTYASAFAVACAAPGPTTLIFAGNPYTESYYGFVFSSISGTGYKITANAVGNQNKDKANGTSCAALVYDFGVTTSGLVTKSPADCWAK